MTTAKFIYDSPSRNADLYYATRFLGTDPIIFFICRGKTYLVLSDLEIDRGKKEAHVDRLLPLSYYRSRAEERRRPVDLAALLHEIFSDFHIRKLIVPPSTSCALVDRLRRRGYRIETGQNPFFPERMTKTQGERRNIEAAQRASFSATKMVEETLRRSRIRNGRLVFRGKTLTSERVHALVSIFLLERGYSCPDPIVAGGVQACDPHFRGAGSLKPHQAIIVDIFPQSQKTGYFGDSTRTFCKGTAPEALRRLYATVVKAQSLAIKMIRSGINGRNVYDAVMGFFVKQGCPTGKKSGRMQGFFHGVGHSIGLEIHEEPGRISSVDYRLRSGVVMSVEPGLYYPAIGGVRIEDLVYITDRGADVLGHYPKRLKID